MIPASFIADLLARIDVVDLIDGFVPLKKAGANYAACCPFHSEKTPSFTVSPTKQFYHCFGCGASGNAIGFVMQYQGLDFVEGVHQLANRLGLTVPDDNQGPGHKQATRGKIAALTEVMAQAAEFYRRQLDKSSSAQLYLQDRGINQETIARYGLGYAPKGNGLKSVFPDYKDPQLQVAGLVIENESGRLYDRFRERIIFPIKNTKGETIAFGGRILDTGEPKYLNSPETPLFEKRRELFGLPEARQALREHHQALVVEGYMDVIALARHGIGNALATLGTATTLIQVQKLLRQADTVLFCFDGDEAGRKAAWRALDNALPALVDHKLIKFVFLPSGEDPDSYINAHGAANFQRLLHEAMPLSDFLINELASRTPPESAEGRAALLQAVKPLLQRVQAPALRLQLVKQLALKSSFSQVEVERLCELSSFKERGPARSPRQALSLTRTLLRLCLQDLNLLHQIPLQLLDNSAEGEALRTLHHAAREQDDDHAASLSYPLLLEKLRGTELCALVEQQASTQLQQNLGEDELAAEFNSALQKLEENAQGKSWLVLQEKAQKFGVSGLTAAEKATYLQLISSGRHKHETPAG